VITIHGCPGDQREWSSWEKQMGENKIRWLNIIVPGFDNEDERRGNYSGSIEDICILMKMLLDDLGIKKVIVLGHSMGSYISNAFVVKYP
jgi:pimeloyl-ACP methyl ester carboxylesterase